MSQIVDRSENRSLGWFSVLLIALGVGIILWLLWSTFSSRNSGTLTIEGLAVGKLVTTTSVDREGCPAVEVKAFSPDLSVYLASVRSDIPKGTVFKARLLTDEVEVAASPSITAAEDASECIWFEFRPTTPEGFPAGFYLGELLANGEVVGSTQFEVR
jgi:hypothetical protein